MQSKKQSAVESCLNIGSGFIVSVVLWRWVIAPLWDIPVNFADDVGIVASFTAVSVIRSYLWRRYFNWRHG